MNHIQGECSTCNNININGANLYNIKSCTHLEDNRAYKRFVLPIFAKIHRDTILLPQYYRKKGQSSTHMEKEGLIRAMAHLEAHDIAVETIVTDRHPQI